MDFVALCAIKWWYSSVISLILVKMSFLDKFIKYSSFSGSLKLVSWESVDIISLLSFVNVIFFRSVRKIFRTCGSLSKFAFISVDLLILKHFLRLSCQMNMNTWTKPIFANSFHLYKVILSSCNSASEKPILSSLLAYLIS